MIAPPQTNNPAAVESATGSTPEGVAGDGPVSASYASLADGAMPADTTTPPRSRVVSYVSLRDGALHRRDATGAAVQVVRQPQATLGSRLLALFEDPWASDEVNGRLAYMAAVRLEARRAPKHVPARLLLSLLAHGRRESQLYLQQMQQRDVTIAQLSASVASLTQQLELARMHAVLVSGGR